MINDTLGIIIRAPWHNDDNNFGFLAQDVLKEFPELVAMDSTSGLFEVNYIGFIPFLLEAVISQQQQIEELKAALNKKSELKSAEFTAVSEIIGEASLGQNIPNPLVRIRK